MSGTLNGAGSTRPGGRAWRLEAPASRRANPDVTVNYDPVGSGGGREQFLAGGVALRRLGRRPDRPTSSTRRQDALRTAGPRSRYPVYVSPIAGRLQPRRRRQAAAVRRRRSPRSSTGKITKWDDAGDHGRQPRTSTLPEHRDHPGAPLGRVGHHRELHRLPEQGRRRRLDLRAERRVADQGRRGRRGHLRRHRTPSQGGKGTIGYADASQAGDLGVAAIKVGDALRRADAPRPPPRSLDGLDAGRRPRRQRHRASRSTAPRRTRAPTRSSWSSYAHRLPDVRRRQDTARPGQGLPAPTSLSAEGQAGRRQGCRLGPAAPTHLRSEVSRIVDTIKAELTSRSRQRCTDGPGGPA